MGALKLKPAWKYLETKTGERVKVDEEDYDKVRARSWRVVYSRSHKPSVVTSLRQGKKVRTMTLGQFILNTPKGQMVYPRRWQNGLDYRKQNLLVCSMEERQRMLPKRSRNSSSQYKGVSYVKSKKVWRARVEKNGCSHFLGDYDTEAEAARAYNRGAKELFGELAYQNQIVENKERRH